MRCHGDEQAPALVVRPDGAATLQQLLRQGQQLADAMTAADEVMGSDTF